MIQQTAYNSTLRPGKGFSKKPGSGFKKRLPGEFKSGNGFKSRGGKMKCVPKNPFHPNTRQLFMGAPCWNCGKKMPDCGHHTDGRVSASPYNFSPMHNELCHINRNGKMGGHAYHMKRGQQAQYRAMTKHWLDGIGYQPTEADKEYLAKYLDE